jgi:hypothetical protein
MLLQRAMIVWAMAATALPVDAVYAAAATPAAPSAAIESSPPSPEPAPSVPTEGLQLDAKPAGLAYKMDVPAAAPRPDDYRFDFAQRPAPEAVLRLSPVVSTLRTGWAFSGRMGPLRWLTPIDGEGETKMRLWGRVPGQPSTPGMGTFNINFHYAFE